MCSFPTLLSLCEYKASRKSLSWKLRALSTIIVARSKSVLWTNWFACCALSVSPFVVLPYVRGVPEKISRVLHNNGVKVGYKPLNVLRTCFPRPKDKPPALQCRGVVYRVACIDCNFVYYGQTDRALETRLKEHKRAVRVGDNNSKVVQHANQFVHCIDFSHGTPPLYDPHQLIGGQTLSWLHLERYLLYIKQMSSTFLWVCSDHRRFQTVIRTSVTRVDIASCVTFFVLTTF